MVAGNDPPIGDQDALPAAGGLPDRGGVRRAEHVPARRTQPVGSCPADTGKQARKRSVATDGAGIPLGLAAAGANPPRLPLPAPTCRPRSPRWAPCLTRSSPILIAA